MVIADSVKKKPNFNRGRSLQHPFRNHILSLCSYFDIDYMYLRDVQ